MPRIIYIDLIKGRSLRHFGYFPARLNGWTTIELGPVRIELHRS